MPEHVPDPVHHVAYYNGKRVVIDYLANPKDAFKRACQRVQDNAGEGVVVCPDGKRYRIAAGSRKAVPMS